jgi:Ni/Fe-hydrogenase subunit HybB-like protein
MSTRASALKAVLWGIVGVLLVVTVARFARGLGATTALSDAAPWGFWIAFDVMAGVALAAGGFVLAASVYIFGLEKYRPFVRPAILTAFLGYAAVASGLVYDLGLPWHIWYPVIFPQHHSVLFEVAMCVILYLTVLSLEFAPVILEHPRFEHRWFKRVLAFLRRATIPLVITGIVLSTLHQSSLGSLFLITPFRLHPLWYTPIIWILFFVSAVGLGLMMVTAESFFSAWVFGHRLRMDLLSGLGRAASVVLLFYAGLRLTDLAMRGNLGAAFDGSWEASLFLFEISLGAVVPGLLLLLRGVRTSPAGLATCSAMTVFGMIGYRFDVCILAFMRPEGTSYFPAWTEIAVSVGIVAVAMLVFIFFVERLAVYPEEHDAGQDEAAAGAKPPSFEPVGMTMLLPKSLALPRRYSLAAVSGASLAIAFLPDSAVLGVESSRTAVSPPRIVDGFAQARDGEPGHHVAALGRGGTVPAAATRVELYLIDGNRDGRLGVFDHKGHVARLEKPDACATCHHGQLPLHQHTACHECHRDMYAQTDIFDHFFHVDALGGNDGCVQCHDSPEGEKTRETAPACEACHVDMLVDAATIERPPGGTTGLAPGYMDAMHGLCIDCHERPDNEPGEPAEYLSSCTTCHRELPSVELLVDEPRHATSARLSE